MLRFRHCAAMLAFLAMLVCVKSTQAQSRAAGVTTPRVAAGLTLRSLSDAQALADQWEFPLPPALTAQGIRGWLPFLQSQDLRLDSPFGAYFIAGQGVLPQRAAIFALPVNASAAPITRLNDVKGAQHVPGQPDTLVFLGVPLRRTQHYFFFGGSPETIGQLSEGAVLGPYRGSTSTLIRGDLSLAFIRQADPQQLEDRLKQIERDARSKSRFDLWLARSVTTLLREDLDHLEFELQKQKSDHRAVLRLLGLKPWLTTRMPQPVLPGKVLARVDVVYPDHDTAMWPARILRTVFDLASADRAAGKAEKREQEVAFIERVAPAADSLVNLLAGSEGLTLAILDAQPHPYLVVIQQHRRVFDLDAALAKVMEELQAGAILPEFQQQKMALDDKLQITRWQWRLTGEHTLYADALQQDRTVVMTFSLDPAQPLKSAWPVKWSGQQITTGLEGTADVAALLKANDKLRGGGAAPKADAGRETLMRALQNKPMRFEARFEGKKLAIECDIPRELPQALRDLR